QFEHYVFAYSGASGGTIGSSILCASRYAEIKNNTPDTLFNKCYDLYRNDFLTPDIVGLLGRDIWFSPLGFKGYDRAYLQEKNWEKHTSSAGFDYSKGFSEYWYDPAAKYEIPLLFANSYNLDSGLKAIVAPVKLNAVQFPGTVFIHDLINDSLELKLST